MLRAAITDDLSRLQLDPASPAVEDSRPPDLRSPFAAVRAEAAEAAVRDSPTHYRTGRLSKRPLAEKLDKFLSLVLGRLCIHYKGWISAGNKKINVRSFLTEKQQRKYGV